MTKDEQRIMRLERALEDLIECFDPITDEFTEATDSSEEPITNACKDALEAAREVTYHTEEINTDEEDQE